MTDSSGLLGLQKLWNEASESLLKIMGAPLWNTAVERGKGERDGYEAENKNRCVNRRQVNKMMHAQVEWHSSDEQVRRHRLDVPSTGGL